MTEFRELSGYVGDKVVTVNVLRVDGKKLTLQFFKQIAKDDWLDAEHAPRADFSIWGRVHYRIPNEGSEWLLGQVGQELKRCNIDPPSSGSALLNYLQGALARATESAENTRRDLVAKESELAKQEHTGIRKILEGGRDQLKATLARHEADMTTRKAEMDAEQAKQAVLRRRAERVEDLRGVPQLFIG